MEIYKKYSDPKTNKISREKFLLLISKLSKNVKEIKGIEMDVVNAIFLIFDKDSDGYIDSEEFIEWWSSSKRFSYFDEDTKARLIPHCIEPSFGVERTLLAVLSDAYTEDEGCACELGVALGHEEEADGEAD